MITVHECEQGTSEWQELRHGLYTGSNAHKLLKYGAIEYALTEASKFTGNYYTKRGHILEDEAIGLYESITRSTVSRPGFVTNSLYIMAGYSPDGFCVDRVVEVKCFNKIRHMQLYKGDIPLEVQAQIHFGMFICDKPFADLVIYNPDFAKKLDDNGQPNKDYNPKLAVKIIPIKANRNIQNNFKRILKTGKVTA